VIYGHIRQVVSYNTGLYRGPAIDASYQVSVHLAKRFQRRRFLQIGQSETRIACGGHVWVGIIYGMSSMKIAHFVSIVSKHGHHMQFLFLIGHGIKAGV
jgi:hypothetical protein